MLNIEYESISKSVFNTKFKAYKFSEMLVSKGLMFNDSEFNVQKSGVHMV